VKSGAKRSGSLKWGWREPDLKGVFKKCDCENPFGASLLSKAVANLESKRLLKEYCMALQNHLAELKRKHDALDREITKEMIHPAMDELRLLELKRKKLLLKDEIVKLRCEIAPTLH